MKVLVTGSRGFLGSHLMRALADAQPRTTLTAPASSRFDLRRPEHARKAVAGADGIYHLAGVVGGIEFNLKRPAELIHDNATMALNLLEAARRTDPEWIILVSSACAYPAHAPVPTHVESLWDGYPEESNAPYGVAKRLMVEAGLAYAKQYGLRTRTLIPANLYGPGDHFDPAVSHVVPALIHRFHHAMRSGARSVTCWGDGSPTRDLLYVGDLARILVEAPRRLKDANPLNVGTGRETSIRQLAEAIAVTVGFSGRLDWDTRRPLGQRRRALDNRPLMKRFGRIPWTPLGRGLQQAYAAYLKTKWAKTRGSKGA